MPCRCAERREVLRRAAAAASRGEVAEALRDARFVGRTLVQDIRSGALAQAARARLAQRRAR